MGEVTRREFQKTALAVGVGTALSGLRIAGANDKVRVGLIGCGGRGSLLWDVFLKQPEIDPVAVCDVYEPFMAKAKETAGGKPAMVKDYRAVLDRKDIDAVIIATPDHWHALQTIQACEAGKDVYCEKPLTLVVREGRLMVDAARAHKRVVAAGSQQRSGLHYVQAVKMIKDGAIGEVHRISAGFSRNAMPGFVPKELTGTKPPANFDWDAWLGPAPERPFDPFRAIYNFRWFWDYSGGQMTNWGAHHLDIARWIVGADGPTAVSAFGGRYAMKDGGETPDIQEVLYEFPGVIVTWTISEISGGDNLSGLIVHGSNGTMLLDRGGFKITPERWTGNDPKAPDKKFTAAMEPMEVKGVDLMVPHVRNFLECLKSREKPNADVEIAHQTAAMCHLGNIATRLGRTLKWDAKTERFAHDEDANKLLTKPYRKPHVLKGLQS